MNTMWSLTSKGWRSIWKWAFDDSSRPARGGVGAVEKWSLVLWEQEQEPAVREKRRQGSVTKEVTLELCLEHKCGLFQEGEPLSQSFHSFPSSIPSSSLSSLLLLLPSPPQTNLRDSVVLAISSFTLPKPAFSVKSKLWFGYKHGGLKQCLFVYGGNVIYIVTPEVFIWNDFKSFWRWGFFFGKFAFYISQLMYCALLVIDWLIDWGKKIRDKWFSPTLVVLLGK